MTLFWILAGGLLLLAMLLVLSPLWRARASANQTDGDHPPTQDAVNLELFRQQIAELDTDLATGKLDPDQHQSARLELERELLHDIGDSGATAPEHPQRGRWLLPILALALPALAVVLYQSIGTPEIIPRLAASSPATGHGNGEMPALDVLADRLAARLEQNPEDLEGWMMLGRTWFALGQPAQALAALQAAYGLAPENLEVKLTYAEALAANKNNQLEGEPARLITEVLAVDPEHTNARWLNGVLSFQRGQYSAAIQSWQRLLEQTDPDSRDAEDLRGLIEQARKRGGVVTTAATQKPRPSEPATTTGPRIQARVSLAPALVGQIPADAIVFIYAKAAHGPPMPLAAQRLRANELPVTLTLDDSMAMNPALTLSSFPNVVVGARVSMTGQVTPMPGDWQGETGPVQVDGDEADPVSVQVVIDQRLP